MESNSKLHIERTKKWINSFVIELNLCPFAHKVIAEDSILFKTIDTDKPQDILELLNIIFLQLNEKGDHSTAFLILEQGFDNFYDFNDFIYISELLLQDQGWSETFQIVGFHPQYIFDGEPVDANSHYTNRSPYPMIHILRVEEMTSAISTHPNTSLIPENNKKLLLSMTLEEIKALISK